MQMDIDYYTIDSNKLPGKYHFFQSYTILEYLPLRKGEEYAVLRMYGVTEGGNSVMAHIHNFLSYFYVEVSPKRIKKDGEGKMVDLTEDQLMALRDKLNGQMSNQ